ncbi:hypothetical protein C4580_03320 [Candidatus Woesearchaeota archaeon]|nr:MAG: hypothetical protein C4580_03320 [Candidatus Woesearchaeota archaeon]
MLLKKMDVRINVEKKHLYGFAAFTLLLASALLTVAFGTDNPAVFGHSALELIVNSSSIVDGSIQGADIGTNAIGAAQIDSTSLASECTSITGGAGLCDGSDADSIGISSCSRFSGSPSASCGGSERLTGGGCSCPGGAVVSQTFSTPAGNLGGGLTCTCTAGAATADVMCCS